MRTNPKSKSTKPTPSTPKRGRGGVVKPSRLPMCKTITAAVQMTGIPASVWSTAKRHGSPGFDRQGQIQPREVLEWWFTKRSDETASTDWKGRRLKAQALQAELDLEVARGEVIPATEVQSGIIGGVTRAFAVWDRASSLIPPRAKGLPEADIKALMVQVAEDVKAELRASFAKWMEDATG